MRAPGFTLIELTVVMVVLGVLAATAYPRFAGRAAYDELAARDLAKQALRQAQNLAMGRTDAAVRFLTTATSIDLRVNGASVARPGGGSYPVVLAGVGLNALDLSYDRLGSPGAAATLVLTGTERTLQVCIDGVTGYAYDC
ncbi:MAG: type II secretion system protein [Gammaproteobacteria bacterium]|nr:type II secretion system protein [Gammaproteobacteria bacterium]